MVIILQFSTTFQNIILVSTASETSFRQITSKSRIITPPLIRAVFPAWPQSPLLLTNLKAGIMEMVLKINTEAPVLLPEAGGATPRVKIVAVEKDRIQVCIHSQGNLKFTLFEENFNFNQENLFLLRHLRHHT